jgi:hypothetical protein
MKRDRMMKAITRVLAPIGFERSGPRWLRQADDVLEVVSLNVAKGGERVQVELGIFDPVPYRQVWSTIPRTVTDAECVVRRDLGYQCGDSGPWDPESTRDCDIVAGLLSNCGVAWLESMHSRRARVSFLRDCATIPSELAMLAMSEAAIGEIVAARRRLEALRARVVGDAWRDKIDDMLAILDRNTTPF